jgi:hypothetical protein
MKSFAPTLLLLVLTGAAGCAHLVGTTEDPRQRTALWAEAQEALAVENFVGAEAAFSRLADGFANSLEGRESLFYLGSIRLDPRNPEWDPAVAQTRLGQYLSYIAMPDGPRLYRYPEAHTLHEIARQLNLPPDSRVAGLQPEERVVTIAERVVVPAEQSRELASEVERLRQQLAERETRIRQQQEELERIRRTLTGPGRI